MNSPLLTREQIIEALRCSATLHNTCKEDCPYRVEEEVKPDFPVKPGFERNGVQYWVSCDCDKICLDAADMLEKGRIRRKQNE